MAIFKGAGVAIITPMKENLKINYDKLGELIDEQVAGGTDAIIICGTTGESSTMSHEEHLETIRFAAEKTAGRIPVIAGAGSNCTDTEVYLSTEAERSGADALLLVTPYYNKATQRGLKEHFTAAARKVNIPIILYNIPGRTGCTLQPQTIADLVHDVDNIVGVKEATGDIGLVSHLMALTQGDIELYSGNDDQIVPLLSIGGLGVISVLSNVAPRQTHDIVQLFMDGKIKESAALQLKAMPLIDALFCEVNPIPVKAAMNILGKEVGLPRLPLTDMEPANKERIKKAMQEFGLM